MLLQLITISLLKTLIEDTADKKIRRKHLVDKFTIAGFI